MPLTTGSNRPEEKSNITYRKWKTVLELNSQWIPNFEKLQSMKNWHRRKSNTCNNNICGLTLQHLHPTASAKRTDQQDENG